MRFLVPFLLLASLLAAEPLRVAVAANVTYAMEELKSAFLAHHPGKEMEVILGSSGKLTAQIVNGAPYDAFLSANMKYPAKLESEGLAVTKPEVYARGGLILLTVSDRLDLSKGIKLAADPDVKKIAVANYKLAPYGLATVEAMKSAGVFETCEPKFANAESITQTVQYTLTATDIGFVAKSTVFSPKMAQYNKKGTYWVDVDPALYTPIDQGVVLLKHGEKNPTARAFVEFILSDKARKIFEAYGYME